MTNYKQKGIDANEVKRLHDSKDGQGSLFQLESRPSLHQSICRKVCFVRGEQISDVRNSIYKWNIK